MTVPLRVPLRRSPFPIIAELGNDRCAALGVVGRGDAPCLDLCRKLIAVGLDPDTPLHVYRQGVLALRIRNIGGRAELEVTTSNEGTPVFRKYRKARGAGPPVASNGPTLPEAPANVIDAPGGVGAPAGERGRA